MKHTGIIYLTRHGQDEDNSKGLMNGHRNSPLTKLGIQQAHTLADQIKEKKLDIQQIISSPLIRCYQTSQIIADTLNLRAITIWDLLIERDFGSLSGTPIKDIEKNCTPYLLKSQGFYYALKAEEIEEFPDLLKRAQQIIQKIEKKYAEQNVLLVTHGDIGKMVYTAYFNLDWKDVFSNFIFGNTEVLKLSPDTSTEDSKIISADQFNF